MALKDLFKALMKKNPAGHKRRAGDSWWHKATFVAAGYIIARNTSDAALVDWVKEFFELTPYFANYIVENAVAIVAIGSLWLKFKEKKGTK